MATIGTIDLAKGDIYTTAHVYSQNRANDGYGMLTGCDVHQKATPAMGVTVDAGAVMYNGTYISVVGGDVTIDAANATLSRIDIVYINAAGAALVAKGSNSAILPTGETNFTKMTSPYPTASIPAGVILARVYVGPGVTTILNADINDIAMLLTQVPLGVLTTRGDIPFRNANTWDRLPKGTTNQVLVQGANDPAWTTRSYALEFALDGSGVTILTGFKPGLEAPVAGTITAARLMSMDNTSGSISISVYKGTYANSPGSMAGVYAASITSTTKSAATGLSISVAAGDWILPYVNSVTSLKCVVLSLTVTI